MEGGDEYLFFFKKDLKIKNEINILYLFVETQWIEQIETCKAVRTQRPVCYWIEWIEIWKAVVSIFLLKLKNKKKNGN